MMHALVRGATVALLTLAPLGSAYAPVALAQVASAPAASAPAAPAPIARALPDSVADFAGLVRQLSDAGGYFDTDNLISNERGYQQVLRTIEQVGVRGGAYIGVGPDQNFTYIARVRPQIAFLTDIRRDNMLQHLLFKALFARARTRIEYLALLTGRVGPSNAEPFATRPIQALVDWIDNAQYTSASGQRAHGLIRDELQRSGMALSATDLQTIARFHQAFMTDGLSLRFASAGRAPQPHYPTLRQLLLEHDEAGTQRSYLAAEDDYQFVKSMHRRNLIVPVTGDLAGPRTFAGIGRYLREHGARVSVLYVSNVEDYLLRDGTFAAYLASVRALPRDDRAVVIRSYFGGGYGHPEATPEYYATQLVQRLSAFVADTGLARTMRYRDLVNRDWIARRPR